MGLDPEEDLDFAALPGRAGPGLSASADFQDFLHRSGAGGCPRARRLYSHTHTHTPARAA